MPADAPTHADCWAKLARADNRDRTSAIIACLPLVDHCRDVAACAASILGYEVVSGSCSPNVLRRRLARLVDREDLTPVACARLCVFAGLHDLGKANRGFQRKRDPIATDTRGHLAEALGLFCCDHVDLQERWLQAIGFASLTSWCGDALTACSLLTAAICHHGRIVDADTQGLPQLWQPGPDLDPIAELKRLRIELDRMFAQASMVGPVLPTSPEFQHAFCGLVQLADWIGSDTRFFPIMRTSEQTGPWRFRQAGDAIQHIGLALHPMRASLPDRPSIGHILPAAASPQPSPMQAAILAAATGNDGSILLVEDETGAGKTEAALLHFARLARAGLVDGLFFALPTRTAAAQIFERVHTARHGLFGDQAPAVILAVPGYLRADDASGVALPGFEVLWNEHTSKSRGADGTAHRFWAAERSKRYLSGAIVVGTVDQALLATLAVPHHHLRATPLLRHLLVVDEVHASDSYMTALLERLLERHRSAGGHALLLSATLGCSAAARLLAPGRRGRDLPAPDTAKNIPYPLLRNQDGATQAVDSARAARQITITCQPMLGRFDAVAEHCLAHARAGARVLVIRNTVGACRQTFARLCETAAEFLLAISHADGRSIPVPHHSRYAAEDRHRLDAAVAAAIGRQGPATGGRIVVATQTCEQSLDIDADFLVTDLCPSDVLLQRLGRLHRHRQRRRPAGYELPRALVLVGEEPLLACLDHAGQPRHAPAMSGFGTVYEDLRILDATWSTLLDPELRPLVLPRHNRTLVEACTHPQALSAHDSRDRRWFLHGQTRTGTTLARRNQARDNVLPWDIPLDLSDERYPRLSRSAEVERRITTRLGLDDRHLELEPGTRGPFGHEIRHLNLPGHWFGDRGLPLADQPDDVQHDDHGLTISLGDWRFRYDAGGLALLP